MEVDLVGHEGGNAIGEHAYTLTVTDIATGWTENRSVPNKARKWVIAALADIAKVLPFPLLGIDSDNGSEFINHHLLAWCEERKLTFTRSRPGNSNDGAHVEQKNWAVVRTVVGYHRYDTPAELLLLNKIWVLQSQMTNYFLAQQKLISKVRDGAKVTKKYDVPTTPHRGAERHKEVSAQDKTIMKDTLTGLNPAAIQRQIQALTAELLTLTTSKASARRKPKIATTVTRASAHVSQRSRLRAHLDMSHQVVGGLGAMRLRHDLCTAKFVMVTGTAIICPWSVASLSLVTHVCQVEYPPVRFTNT